MQICIYNPLRQDTLFAHCILANHYSICPDFKPLVTSNLQNPPKWGEESPGIEYIVESSYCK